MGRFFALAQRSQGRVEQCAVLVVILLGRIDAVVMAFFAFAFAIVVVIAVGIDIGVVSAGRFRCLLRVNVRRGRFVILPIFVIPAATVMVCSSRSLLEIWVGKLQR